MSSGVFLLLVVFPYVTGHGYLADPPARNSMWRYGFDTPKNYNDAEQNCGGFSVSKIYFYVAMLKLFILKSF